MKTGFPNDPPKISDEAKSMPVSRFVVLSLAFFLCPAVIFGRPQIGLLLIPLLISAFGIGFLSLCLLRAEHRPRSVELWFATGVGVIVLCGIAGLVAASAMHISLFFLISALATTIGWAAFLKTVGNNWSQGVPGGGLFLGVMTVVGWCFFGLGVKSDMVQQADGSYVWLHEDTAHSMSIAVRLKIDTPPRLPGFAESSQTFAYHFGSQSAAAFVSKLFGFEIADCLLAFRGLALLSLLFACLAIGTILAPSEAEHAIAPTLTAMGLFACGAFTEFPVFLLSKVLGAEARDCIPTGCDGIRSMMIGHSVLWGMLPIVSVVGYLPCHLTSGKLRLSGFCKIALLASFGLLTNVFGGLVAVFVVCSTYLLKHFRQINAWFLPIWSGCCVLIVLWAMGTFQSPQQGGGVLEGIVDRFEAAVWRTLAFGPLLYGALHVASDRDFPFANVCTSGMLAAIVLPAIINQPQCSNFIYSNVFCFHLLSMLTVPLLVFDFFRKPFDEKGMRVRSVARILVMGTALALVGLMAVAVIERFFFDAAYTSPEQRSGKAVFYVLCALMLAAGAVLCRFGKHNRQIVGMLIAGSLIISSYSFIANVKRHWVSPSEDVPRLSRAEFQTLRWIRDRLPSLSVCATNNVTHHSERKDAHYVYLPVCERLLFVEGGRYGERYDAAFQRAWLENEELFCGADLERVRAIIQRHDIQCLVCAPATDLQVASRPHWLDDVTVENGVRAYTIED